MTFISGSFCFLLPWCLLGLVAIVSSSEPSFLSQPGMYNVISGQDVILPCRINSPSLDYGITWQKLIPNDQPLVLFVERNIMTDDERFELAVNNDASNFDLRIKRLIDSDGATYECSVMVDPPLNQRQVLHVKSPPTVNTVPEKSPTVVEMGGNFRLTCFSTGNPKPKIMWKKLHGSLPKNLHPTQDSGDLYFEGATEENAGTYRCTAENGVGDPMFADIDVEINSPRSDPHPPSVTVASKTIDVRPTETFNITCTYFAHPAPTVEWFFNGYKIEPEKAKTKIIDSRTGNQATTTLIINDTTADDFGDYSCRVFNKLGKAEATVSVTGLPEQARVKVEPNTRDGFSLHWYVDSAEPVLEYQLDYKEFGKSGYQTAVIPADSNTPTNGKTYEGRYDIEKLQPETSYEFVIRARNKIGWGKSVQETLTTGKLQTYRRQADSAFVTKSSNGGNGGSPVVFLSPLVILLAIYTLCVFTEQFPVL